MVSEEIEVSEDFGRPRMILCEKPTKLSPGVEIFSLKTLVF